MSEFGQKIGGNCSMKRLFFVFLFALTALSFAGCSSSDDDNGGSGGTPLAPETVIPSPDIEVPGISKSSISAERSIRYLFQKDSDRGNYFDILKKASAEEGWYCSDSGGLYCSRNTTIDGETYSIVVSESGENDDGKPEIRLNITYNGDKIPSESIFDKVDFHLEGAAKTKYSGYGVSYSFASSSYRSDYKNAYIEKLIEAGFEEDEGEYFKWGGSPAGGFPGSSYYWVELDENDQGSDFYLYIEHNADHL
jgi:hypothetical protein